jgi:hypothetical protein
MTVLYKPEDCYLQTVSRKALKIETFKCAAGLHELSRTNRPVAIASISPSSRCQIKQLAKTTMDSRTAPVGTGLIPCRQDA